MSGPGTATRCRLVRPAVTGFLVALAAVGVGWPQDLVRSEDAVVALFSLQTQLEVDGRMLDRLVDRHAASQQDRTVARERVDRLYTELDGLFEQYRGLLQAGGEREEGEDRSAADGDRPNLARIEDEIDQKEKELLEAESTEKAREDEGRRLREEIRGARERITLLWQKIVSLQDSLPAQKDSVTGVWDITMLPGGDRGVFALFQSGTIVTGQYVLDGPFQGSLEGTLVDRKLLLHRIDARLGRSMDLTAFLSPDGRALRGTWENYDLANGQARAGSWAATRRQPKRSEDSGDGREGGP